VLAATNAHETSVRVVPGGFALRNQRLRLLVGESLVDNVKDLLFGHAGVLQPADLLAGERRQALDAPVNDVLNSRVRETDQFQRYRFAAEDIDLVGLRHFEDLRVRVPRSRQVHGGICAGKFMVVRVRSLYESKTKIIGSASVFQLRKLGDFQVAGLQRPQFVKA